MKTGNIINKLRCIVCDSRNLELNYSLKFGDVFFCRDCRLVFVNFKDIAEFHQANSKWADPIRTKNQIRSLPELRRIALNRFKLLLKYSKKNNLLEFGPNTGEFLYVANKKGFKVAAVDKYPVILNLNKPKDLTLFESDANEFLSLNKFDNIVAFHILEHIESPEKFIRRVWECLNPEGLLFLEVPNYNSLSRKILGRNWYMFYDYHIIHFNIEAMKKILTKNGFRILYWRSIQPLTLYTAPFYLPLRHWLWSKVKSLFFIGKNNETHNKPENYSINQSLSMEEELTISNSIKAKIIRVESLLMRLFSLLLCPVGFFTARTGKGDIIQIIAQKEI